MSFNISTFQQKIQSLKTYSLNKNHISILEKSLPSLDDWQLLRVNPISFGEVNGINEQESIDLFVHAAKVGIFDFRFNMICPYCAGIVHSHQSLDEIGKDNFYCATCDLNSPSNLDDQVEVSFSISPSVKELELDPYKDFETYRRYNFSENIQRSMPHQELASSLYKDFMIAKPDETVVQKFQATTGETYQICSIETNSSLFINFNEKEDRKNSSMISMTPSGISPRTLELNSGEIELKLTNLTKSKIAVVLIKPNLKGIMQIVSEHPPKWKKFLTAKMLLNNQSFRDLFRIQHLSDSLSLNVRSLTIMFTDLRGSTEMYDKAGDLLAYQLVQEHFELLIDSVRKYSGAIVKTMGDAIMASFSNPRDGVLSSIEMFDRIDSMNRTWKEKGYQVGLKIGLNEGSALAVLNDERLDYFGQSVNIAARVQGLASAGEVWVSESVFASPEISTILQEKGFQVEKQIATLKGVGSPTVVYKCYSN
ncbi:MAG: DUF5939 domain-containing protein [Leptospiraceae bacterium]|nr:DUF5939 domain-containing protein [Leptospiraceae bacterium]